MADGRGARRAAVLGARCEVDAGGGCAVRGAGGVGAPLGRARARGEGGRGGVRARRWRLAARRSTPRASGAGSGGHPDTRVHRRTAPSAPEAHLSTAAQHCAATRPMPARRILGHVPECPNACPPPCTTSHPSAAFPAAPLPAGVPAALDDSMGAGAAAAALAGPAGAAAPAGAGHAAGAPLRGLTACVGGGAAGACSSPAGPAVRAAPRCCARCLRMPRRLRRRSPLRLQWRSTRPFSSSPLPPACGT